MRLAPRDSEFGGQVSRWQVAEVIAAAVANPSLAENKVGAAALLGLCLVACFMSACSRIFTDCFCETAAAASM